MTTTLKIIRTKDGVSRNFIFLSGEIKNLSTPSVSQSVSLDFPKDEADDDSEPLTIDLGVQKELSFEWKLYTEDTDRSEGTHTTAIGGVSSGTIQTYEEMLNYLEYVIGFPGIGLVDYTITITDKFRTRTDVYSFQDFNIDVDSGIYPRGTFKFKHKKRNG